MKESNPIDLRANVKTNIYFHKKYHYFVDPGNCILMHPHVGPHIYRKEERE